MAAGNWTRFHSSRLDHSTSILTVFKAACLVLRAWIIYFRWSWLDLSLSLVILRTRRLWLNLWGKAVKSCDEIWINDRWGSCNGGQARSVDAKVWVDSGCSSSNLCPRISLWGLGACNIMSMSNHEDFEAKAQVHRAAPVLRDPPQSPYMGPWVA